MNKLTIGIDVGGTNIKYGLVDHNGQVTVRKRLETRHYLKRRSFLIKAVINAVGSLLQEQHLPSSRLNGIGIGLPGLVDTEKGVVKFLPNIPGWKNVPLKQIFEKALRLPTFLENDVNLITLGEWKFGAGVGVRNLICVTLGTGVGGGLVLDGRLYRGAGFAAGEIGHIPLNESGPRCNCGGFGCFEQEVGNAWLVKKAAKMFHKAITLEEIFDRAGKHDPVAVRFWLETGVHIGNGLTGVVNVLNPRLIIIGGGIARSHRFLFPAIRDTIKRRAMVVQGAMFRIVRAKLGDDAGLIGARVLVGS